MPPEQRVAGAAGGALGFLGLAGLLFFCSGAAGLIYQVVWVKQLTLQFGSSAWSISTVVSAFMAGLGAGSWWAGRRADAIARPFRAYAWLELGIAAFGLISLSLLDHLDVVYGPLYILLKGHFAWFVLVRFLLSFLVLLVPTFLMGASLPVLVVGIARQGAMQKTVGLLYGINTLGAAAGVLLAGFILLPLTGIQPTLMVAVVLGALVGLAALYCDRLWRRAPAVVAPPEVVPTDRPTPVSLLAVVFVCGVLALFYEVSWTRLLAPVVGSSTYAFSIILTTFLLAIGLGGLIAALRWIPKENYRIIIAGALMLSAVTALISLFTVNALPDLFFSLVHLSGGRMWLFFLFQGTVVGLLIFLPTCAMGVVLPLAMVGYAEETGIKGRAIGGIYAANTIGSIAGSVLAGFVLLPLLGVRFAILCGVGVTVLTAVYMILTARELARERRLLLSLSVVGLVTILWALNPNIDYQEIHQGEFRGVLAKTARQGTPGNLLYLREGVSCTVTVYRNADATWMKLNGKADASTSIDLATQYMVGHLPLFYKPDARSVCIIGLGSGSTVRAVATHPVATIDVVELEPAVVEVASYFSSVHDDVLADPRVHLHVEDGRTFLRYGEEVYDVVISEPPNPWLAGGGALFSTDYYQRIHSRLAPDGIFCQWIQYYELSRETLNVMVRTLADEFPHIMFFCYVGGDIICIASRERVSPDIAVITQRFGIPDVALTMQRIGIENPYDVFAGYFGTMPEDVDKFPTDIRNHDDNLWLEYRAPIEMYQGLHVEFWVTTPEVFLERLHTLVFPGEDKGELALRLARSFFKLRPLLSHYIERWIGTLPADSPARAPLAEVARQTEQRRAVLEGEGARIAEANGLLKRDPAAVVAMLEPIRTADPDAGGVLRLLGEAYQKLDQREAAVAAYQQALQANPLDYISHTSLGALDYRRKAFVEGDRHFARALEINPFYIEGRAGWIALLVAHDRSGEAEALYLDGARLLDDAQYRRLEEKVRELAGSK